MISTPLTNINDQFSYVVQIPCETEVGGYAAASNALGLISVPRSYNRSIGGLTTLFANYTSLAFATPAQSNLSMSFHDRGRIEQVDLVVPVDNTDLDGNGLPDWWELLYFGHIGVDPNDDPDGDGLTLLQEFRAGLNPLNPNDHLAFISVRPANPGVSVSWSSKDGVFYVLQRSQSLLSGFTDVATHIQGVAPTNSWQDTTALGAGPYFYRLRVE
jgi:hypothetical protein